MCLYNIHLRLRAAACKPGSCPWVAAMVGLQMYQGRGIHKATRPHACQTCFLTRDMSTRMFMTVVFSKAVNDRCTTHAGALSLWHDELLGRCQSGRKSEDMGEVSSGLRREQKSSPLIQHPNHAPLSGVHAQQSPLCMAQHPASIQPALRWAGGQPWLVLKNKKDLRHSGKLPWREVLRDQACRDEP